MRGSRMGIPLPWLVGNLANCKHNKDNGTLRAMKEPWRRGKATPFWPQVSSMRRTGIKDGSDGVGEPPFPQHACATLVVDVSQVAVKAAAVSFHIKRTFSVRYGYKRAVPTW
jgi:hypothetical protein